MTLRAVLFKEINTIGQNSSQSYQVKREQTQITNIRNEERNITIDSIDITRIIRDYEHFMTRYLTTEMK